MAWWQFTDVSEKTTLFHGVKRPGREVASSAEVENKWSSTIMAYTGETLYIYIYMYFR